MLSERVRNTAVGLTMLAALAALMVAIVKIGGLSNVHAVRPYTVTVVASDTAGVNSGSRVEFNGVPIGSVTYVQLEPDYHVDITCSIDYTVNLPANCVAELSHPVAVGTSSVNFKLRPAERPSATAPATSGPAAVAVLPKDGTARLVASSSDGGLVPQSLVDTLNTAGGNINAVAVELRDMFEKRSLADFDKQDPATRAANVSILVQRIEKAAQGIDSILNDSKTQQQLKETVENVRDATADIKTFTKRLDEGMTNMNTSVAKFGTTADQVGAAATQAGATLSSLQVEVSKTSQRIGDLLASLQKSTDAIAAGKGTAGRLVNDSRLYDGLVDTVKSLKDTTDELNVLIQKWKEEGVDLRFK